MKSMKAILSAFILSGLIVSVVACGPGADETGLPGNRVVTVRRGNLSIDITGSGNLALSRTEDLAFELGGTVEEVPVEEGQSVTEGQLVAKLDKSVWEEHITELEDAVTAAKKNVTAKEAAVTAAERNVTARERAVLAAERQVTVKELDLLQAQTDLQTRKDDINKVEEIAKAKKATEDAEWDLSIARARLQETLAVESSSEVVSFRVNQVALAEARLAGAEKELNDILAGTSARVTDDIAITLAMNKLEVKLAEGHLEDAWLAIDDANQAIEDARQAVEDARQAVEDANQAVTDAGQAVEDARQAVEEAEATSPEVTAPFDGFITRVNVSGGAEVKKGTVAVTIADPTRFDADIMVSEMDIGSLKLGGPARVQVDAMPGMSLPAGVTHISPTATIQQGVVSYRVRVEIQPTEAIARGMGNIPFPSGGEGIPVSPQDLQLREGLTVTVSITVDERNDVLLVPNAAVTARGQQTYVQVTSPDGTAEERPITAGINDWQYTEVIDGLSEGERVIVPQGATGTTTPTQQQQRPVGMMPNLRGFAR